MKMMKDERLSSQILIFISNSMVKVDYNHLKKQVISPKSHWKWYYGTRLEEYKQFKGNFLRNTHYRSSCQLFFVCHFGHCFK